MLPATRDNLRANTSDYERLALGLGLNTFLHEPGVRPDVVTGTTSGPARRMHHTFCYNSGGKDQLPPNPPDRLRRRAVWLSPSPALRVVSTWSGNLMSPTRWTSSARAPARPAGATGLIARNALATSLLACASKRMWIAWGRLSGNLIAFGHLLHGRIRTEFITQF